VQLIAEAIDLHIESLRENGESVPEPSSEGELVEVAA
jgi:predicted RNase H-like HicB family nuclease